MRAGIEIDKERGFQKEGRDVQMHGKHGIVGERGW